MDDDPGSDLAIRAHGLTRRFGTLVAVDHIDLSIPRGQVYGFLGPNGSGKSTTLRMLCGLLTPSAGDVERTGPAHSRRGRGPEAAHRLHDPAVFAVRRPDRAARTCSSWRPIHDLPRTRAAPRVQEVMDRYDLNGPAQATGRHALGGQRQRLALAGSVLHEPELLLLDEPTSAVDPESRRNFWASLFELADAGTTLLVSTHYMDEAERCHRLAILESGRLVADGTPEALCSALPGKVWLLRTCEDARGRSCVARQPRGARRRADRQFPARACPAVAG